MCFHEIFDKKYFFKSLGKSDGDCTKASYCNGKAAQCPEPDHKPDNVTECNQGTQVCNFRMIF